MKIVIRNQSELLALLSGLSMKDSYPIKVNYSFGETRSLSQNALSHVIYSEISKYLINKGRADCSPDWIKKMLKSKFLGWKDETYTDILTGAKTTREVLLHTSGLTSGEMLHYLTQVIEWAESIGVEIRIPADSTYRQLMDKQNG